MRVTYDIGADAAYIYLREIEAGGVDLTPRFHHSKAKVNRQLGRGPFCTAGARR